MATIGSIPAPIVAYVGGLGALTTILLCYVLAVSFKHVPAWLPMISDCAVYAPEKYPFRAGIVITAAAFAVQTVVVYNAERSFSKSKVALALGLLSAICLTVIGVVNEDEWNTVHNVTAAVFFALFELYMILITWFSCHDKRLSFGSNIIKLLCTIYGAIALAVVAILSGIGFDKYEVYIAVCEWTGTFAICIFQMALGYDLSGVVLSEVETENSGVREKIALSTDQEGVEMSGKAPLLESFVSC